MEKPRLRTTLLVTDGEGYGLQAGYPMARTEAQCVLDWPGRCGCTVETLSEEVGYRGFVQGRLTPYLGTLPVLMLTNLLFAAGHWRSFVNLPATALDILFVALDGAIYDWLYARSGNVFVSWLAHLLADVVGLALLLQY